MATNATKAGKVRINDLQTKASSHVSVGDTITVRKDGFNLTFIAKGIISKRVSATLAQPCYDNITSDEEMNKFKEWFIGKAGAEQRDRGTGRPTKRERREIEGFKEDIFDFDE